MCLKDLLTWRHLDVKKWWFVADEELIELINRVLPCPTFPLLVVVDWRLALLPMPRLTKLDAQSLYFMYDKSKSVGDIQDFGLCLILTGSRSNISRQIGSASSRSRKKRIRSRIQAPLLWKFSIYRVFIKYCVFPKDVKYFATSPSPALGCDWLYRK